MKPFIMLFLSAILVSCSESDSSDSSDSSSSTNITESIIGAWKKTDQATLCETSLVLNSNLQFTHSSLVNVSSGTFTVTDSILTNDKKELNLFYSADNGLSNCSGISSNRAGFGYVNYYNLSGSNTLSFYNNFFSSESNNVFIKQL